ncbi:MAG TPA: hypothetical protein VMV74_09230 [Bacteroidales bacterium]|nr:hypothetical protein [Bacteroidales bacterium]
MTVDIVALPLRSVIVKEASLDGENVKFFGAYRYEGSSLYDILDKVVLKKKNEAEFSPIIDLYVEVSNETGESVVLSWGELYYPTNRHQVLIATSVTRIVPSKSKDLWPLPVQTKLIVGPDLITTRNISNPSRITIRSVDSKYTVSKGLSPMFSDKMRLCVNGGLKNEIAKLPKKTVIYTYHTVFYGRGMGIHGTTPFTGSLLSERLKGSYVLSDKSLQKGLVVIAGIDGYRAAFTLSEIVNRNDQNEILLIDRGNQEGAGRFSLFPGCDFFSDRAIKSIMEINLLLH